MQSSFSPQKCCVILCASSWFWNKSSSTRCSWIEADNIWDKVKYYSFAGTQGGREITSQISQNPWLLSSPNSPRSRSLWLFKAVFLFTPHHSECSLSAGRPRHCRVELSSYSSKCCWQVPGNIFALPGKVWNQLCFKSSGFSWKPLWQGRHGNLSALHFPALWGLIFISQHAEIGGFAFKYWL